MDFAEEWGEEVEGWSRDTKIDEAKEALESELFARRPREVFYGRQIGVLFEDRFFHWITHKSLSELVEEDQIKSEKVDLEQGKEIRFYWSRKNRYWKRQVQEARKVVIAYSRTEFTRGIGRHAEMLFTAGLATVGFTVAAENVRSYKGVAWVETGHDLDRVFERDGIVYGTEIKNTLDYIELEELEIKLKMCSRLGLKPLFIMRMAPKTYIEKVRQARGFSLIFKWQLYPYGHDRFARKVRDTFGLPVDSPQAIEHGTAQRFLRWHLKAVRSQRE